jgi:hypothetical protein
MDFGWELETLAYLDLNISQWSNFHSTYRNRRRSSQDRFHRTTRQYLLKTR